MVKIKLVALAVLTVTLTCLPMTTAVAAGPLLAPWIVGRLVGAAVRLATLPIVSAAAAGAAGQPPWPASPRYYGSGDYYASPPYYQPPAYYPYPRYMPQGYGAPAVSYYGGRQPHYYPGGVYRAPSGYAGPSRAPLGRGYYLPSVRYSGWHGRAVFGGSRGVGNRRW